MAGCIHDADVRNAQSEELLIEAWVALRESSRMLSKAMSHQMHAQRAIKRANQLRNGLALAPQQSISA